MIAAMKAMRLNRSHPDISRDRKWFLDFMFMHGLFTCAYCLLLYSTIFHDIKKEDFTQAVGNAVIAVLYNIVSFCYFIMLVKQDSLICLISSIQRDYLVANDLLYEEKLILMKYANRGKWIVKFWTFLICCCGGLFPLKSVILMLYYWFIGEFQLVPIYNLTYPPILEQSRENFLSFLCLDMLMLWYCVYAIAMYVGLVPLGPIFMLHACGQLELVKHRLKKLFPDYNYNCEKSRNLLRRITLHMQEVDWFVDRIRAGFKLLYELSLKGTTLTMPLLIYEIIETFKKSEISLEFIFITIASIALSSIPCYYSDVLSESGWSVRQAVYFSGWEKYFDLSIRKSILLILTRTLKPVAIRSMFRDVCLGALAEVFQQAYAIFNFINVVW